jgi:YHS domain-containing protein
MRPKKMQAWWLATMTAMWIILTGCSHAISPDTADQIAIKKYDPVAYFTEHAALQGNDAHTFSYHGMIWYFTTAEHRQLFRANPEKYAPQYDGYCAWAMTESRLAQTDPEVWKIVDGKLYLNCSQAAYEKWSRDIPGHIRKADAIWAEKFGHK